MKDIFITVYNVNFQSTNFTNIHKFFTNWALILKTTTKKRARQNDVPPSMTTSNWNEYNSSQRPLYGSSFLKSSHYIEKILPVEFFLQGIFIL